MLTQEELLTEFYNAFDPFEPLPVGDRRYVDCREVRGDVDTVAQLARPIIRLKRMTCQLYAGHRGAGKSTELLRLKQYLEKRQTYVVYFAADTEDIDPAETQYVDILLACTRQIIKQLKDIAKPEPVLEWLRERWSELKELALTEIELEGLTVEAQLTQFARLTANIKKNPNQRDEIRKKVDRNTESLIIALNQFINEARNQLPPEYNKIAVIADSLDRIVPIIQEDKRTNHEHIFIEHSEQLRQLDCHVVYTLPLSIIYSSQGSNLRENYDGEIKILPMIMTQTREGKIHETGLKTIKEIITQRIAPFASHLCLETEIFDSPETLQELCLISGGHVRNLLLLIQAAINETDVLPISARAVKRSISSARETYRKSVQDSEWQLLAQVARSQRIRNIDEYRNLLFNRCILEYQDKEADEIWHQVHPFLQTVPEFKQACEELQ